MASTCSETTVPKTGGGGDIPEEKMSLVDISLNTDGPAEFNYWRHSPLHPRNNQPITFYASISDNSISKIELIVLEYQLYTNSDNLPSKKRRPRGTWEVVKTWNYPTPVNNTVVDYRYANGFPASSNVEYIFRVTNRSGQISDRLAIFDAGDSPWNNDKILLYSTTRQPMQRTINLCFFADKDFNRDWNLFKSDVESLIYDGYHQNHMVGGHRDKWAFYYTPQEMDGKRASSDVWNTRLYPDFITSNRIEGIDAFGLLHREPYKDHALIKENINFVTNTLFTSESYNIGTAVHETAHAVFKLSDEYDQCACFQTGEWSNVFQTLENCIEFTRENGMSVAACRQVQSLSGDSWYTPEENTFFNTPDDCRNYNRNNNFPADSCITFIDFDGRKSYWAFMGTCIMHDDGDRAIRQFQDVCGNVIEKYYDRLENGNLAAIPFSNNTILTENVDNMFGYEKVVAMHLTSENNEQQVGVQKIKMGVRTKNIIQSSDLNLEFKSNNEKMLHKVQIDNPGKVLSEGKGKSEIIRKRTMSDTYFNIPYHEEYAKAVCHDLEEIKMRPRGVAVPPGADMEVFDIKNEFQKAKESFFGQ